MIHGLRALVGEPGTDMRENAAAEQPAEPQLLGEPPPADDPAPSPEALADRELFPTEQARHSAFAEARRTLAASFEQRYSARVSELEADYQSRLSERDRLHAVEVEQLRAALAAAKATDARPSHERAVDAIRENDRLRAAKLSAEGKAIPPSLAHALATGTSRLLDPDVPLLDLTDAERRLVIQARGLGWYSAQLRRQAPKARSR